MGHYCTVADPEIAALYRTVCQSMRVLVSEEWIGTTTARMEHIGHRRVCLRVLPAAPVQS